MKHKTQICCIILSLLSAVNVYANQPPRTPELYDTGPASALLSNTQLNTVDKTLYALYQAIISVSKGVVNSKSCTAVSGKYSVNVTVNGVVADPKNNQIIIKSVDNNKEPFILQANVESPLEFRGQEIKIEQFGKGLLGDSVIEKFGSNASFNLEGSMVSAENSFEINGINGVNEKFKNNTIDNLYISTDPNQIHGWGSDSLSKLDFPIEKYWMRSKIWRQNGVFERVILANDRVIGASPCRILFESVQVKNQDKLMQTGILVISDDKPNVSALDFNFKPEV